MLETKGSTKRVVALKLHFFAACRPISQPFEDNSSASLYLLFFQSQIGSRIYCITFLIKGYDSFY